MEFNLCEPALAAAGQSSKQTTTVGTVPPLTTLGPWGKAKEKATASLRDIALEIKGGPKDSEDME